MNTQSGRSMIEMLAVIAIMGIIVVSATIGINQGMVKYNSSKLHTDMQSIADDVYNLYNWSRGYPGNIMTTTGLCREDVFPDGCNNDDTTANNPFGGTYTVGIAECPADEDDEVVENVTCLKITASGVPAEECALLVTNDWGTAIGDPTCEADTEDNLKKLVVHFP